MMSSTRDRADGQLHCTNQANHAEEDKCREEREEEVGGVMQEDDRHAALPALTITHTHTQVYYDAI